MPSAGLALRSRRLQFAIWACLAVLFTATCVHYRLLLRGCLQLLCLTSVPRHETPQRPARPVGPAGTSRLVYDSLPFTAEFSTSTPALMVLNDTGVPACLPASQGRVCQPGGVSVCLPGVALGTVR